ncbi:MAG: hypothetical protein D4R72_00995 [Nitrosopumilales archaeon]|nr:MAG: hypothetical protein D4R72_00995 [Nitrosopumilales archaeon]
MKNHHFPYLKNAKNTKISLLAIFRHFILTTSKCNSKSQLSTTFEMLQILQHFTKNGGAIQYKKQC